MRCLREVSFLVSLLLTVLQVQAQLRQSARVPTCDTGSCYPGTGNLLIGREDRLFASSTCGVRRQEKYCIVSHLEKQRNQQCFWCDALSPSMSHNVSNIVDIMDPLSRQPDPWWQSENGVEKVYIQLNMEAEFHFTHLIINFKTFRPAAMIIERSQDFGKTWKIYRYFAANCEATFSNISTAPPRKLNDVICDNRYSHVNPSNGGELIFRVMPPNIAVEDPYSKEVQELVKMTNLRVNFTRLHTLGDNLLDQRDEILEKYYYAINHMIVRGSCSCYGHASSCLPIDEASAHHYPQDMVHGQCKCKHHTKGPNCDQCEDFYNDLPWKAAYGKSQNACKQCNCNNHATSCKFNEEIFKASGNVSGGVCNDCMDNTVGINCERCKPFFYHDPQYGIQDPHACHPCNCDTQGTVDDGVCDAFTDPDFNMVSGSCHCKQNVGGRRCDRCKEGFWNYDSNNPLGCEPCQCNIHGTVNNEGCNMETGECTCKRFVIGRDCNQCRSQFWGLSEDMNGCKPCECDPGGSYDNQCDVVSGQCRCRPHVTGRTCDKPEFSYFTPLPDYNIYEAEVAQSTPDIKIQIIEPNRDGREVTWTGTGYMRVYEGSRLEFLINDVPSPLKYDLVIRYAPQYPNGWDDVIIEIVELGVPDQRGPCGNETLPRLHTSLPPTARSKTLPDSICLEPGKNYKVILTFDKYDRRQKEVSASVLIDSIVLYPTIEALPIMLPQDLDEFNHYRCAENFLQPNHGQLYSVCVKYLKSVGSYVNQGAFRCDCDPTGSISHECAPLGGQCECKKNVVGRKCDMCSPGTYSFGPEGCIACDCNSLALDNICDPFSGQCKCRSNTYGRTCDQCQVGFWNFPNCQRCECNGYAATCDSKTGVCINCLNFTEGIHCGSCQQGYYGEPGIGYNIPCRPCQCPGTIDSGHSYADRCSLDYFSKDLLCECSVGYQGAHCDECADNFYGSPELPGEICSPCDCSGNIDLSRPDNCDRKTGTCLNCLYNTEGEHCEVCKERFYGDALNHDCKECFCELLGTNQTKEYCDRNTGQCPCLPNVIGKACDECLENHWKIASGLGCEACNCDPRGSYSMQCNPFNGQCDCKDGFGSRQCDQCKTFHWGDPTIKCHKCDCDLTGSVDMQCNRVNGSCNCVPGVGGDRCDQCARGFLGTAPNCDTCGECFTSWDNILNKLRNDTSNLFVFAANIKEVGVWGAYTNEFGSMEEEIKQVQRLLNRTDISLEGIESIKNQMSQLRGAVGATSKRVGNLIEYFEDTDQSRKRADLSLADLESQMAELLRTAANLNENATKLQEDNVEGALNLTRKARKDSQDAEEMANRFSEENLVRSEQNCKRTLVQHNRTSQEIGRSVADNENTLIGFGERLENLTNSIPGINEKVCGKLSFCDAACGGAGCGICGGISCENGAVTKANASLDLVNKADLSVKEKESKAEDLLRNVTLIKLDAMTAKTLTEDAFEKSEIARNKSSEAMKKSLEFTDKLSRFMATAGAKPSEIRSLAEDTKKMNINLEPDKVKDLAAKINNAVRNLTNIKGIIYETNIKKDRAKVVKDEANLVKVKAENVLNSVQNVNIALSQAAKAQSEADKAIRLANTDIATAEKHLTQISSESSEAQSKANETLNIVKNLSDRLLDLNTKFTINKISADEIRKEVDAISLDANRTSQAAVSLRTRYEEAEKLLEARAGKSQSAKDKAKKLSEQANQFFATTTRKEKYLKDLEILHVEKDVSLRKLKDEMVDLSQTIEKFVKEINAQSKNYNDCIP